MALDLAIKAGRPPGKGVTQARTTISEDVFLPSLRNPELIGNESWRDQSLCLVVHEGVDWFSRGPLAIAKAKEVCEQCPVQYECLLFAVQTCQDYGVWGGFSTEERKELTIPYRKSKEQ